MRMLEIFESDNLYTKYFQRRSYVDSDSEKGSQDEVSAGDLSLPLPPAPQQQQQQPTQNEYSAGGRLPVPEGALPPDYDITDNFRARLDTIKRKSLPLYDVVVNAISIVFRFVGIGFSVIVALDYNRKGYTDYMVYTIMCLVIPILMTSFISIEL